MNFRNLRFQRGFTLVEVIVVAVIVAILAGVSVPLYLGYINNSRENAASNAAGSAASFGAACINSGKTFSLIETGTITGDGSKALTCKDGETTVASLVVPAEITLTLTEEDNGITGTHTKGGNPSPKYTFTTPVASGGGGGGGGGGGSEGGGSETP